jgi:hypothetical protein
MKAGTGAARKGSMYTLLTAANTAAIVLMLLVYCPACSPVKAQWVEVDTQQETDDVPFSPFVYDDDDSAYPPYPTPTPTPEPTPEPKRADQQVQAQVDDLTRKMGDFEVLDAYLVDKEAVEKGTCPDGFQQPPLDYYKTNGIKTPLTSGPQDEASGEE